MDFVFKVIEYSRGFNLQYLNVIVKEKFTVYPGYIKDEKIGNYLGGCEAGPSNFLTGWG
jgi:hypothetical protein